MRDLTRDEELFAVERRAVIVARGESTPRVRWEPVGLFSASSLDEAIEKGARKCRIASVLRATPLDFSAELPLTQMEMPFVET